jgi:hypothetical protein
MIQKELDLSAGFSLALAQFVPLATSRSNRIGGNSMRFRTALCLTTVFLLCFTVAAWSTPIPDRIIPHEPRPAPDTQSVSGKISSIGDATFALDVAKGNDMNTIHFLVDDQTKVEGKLRLGAHATVEYHLNGGNNLAVHVVVKKGSGRKP